MTSAPAHWVRWLILVLISVIIALAGQPEPSAAAASIVCALAGAASLRPRGRDNWHLVMLPPQTTLATPGYAAACSVSPTRGTQATTAPEVPSLIAPPRRGR